MTTPRIVSVKCCLSRGGGLWVLYSDSRTLWRSYSLLLMEVGRPTGEQLFLKAWSAMDNWVDV